MDTERFSKAGGEKSAKFGNLVCNGGLCAPVALMRQIGRGGAGPITAATLPPPVGVQALRLPSNAGISPYAAVIDRRYSAPVNVERAPTSLTIATRNAH